MEEMNILKEQKKAIVLEAITAKCKEDDLSSFLEIPQPIQDIRAALTNGDELQAKILTGGLTNFTYMIYTESQDSKLFAKLSFPYTHAMQDHPCPLMRTDSEFAMMSLFQTLAPGCVATPFFCMDIPEQKDNSDGSGGGGDDATLKLLVAEWVTTNEQFGNQFIDGEVDPRTAVCIAKSLAALHCSQQVEMDFNEEIRPFISSIDPIINAIVGGYILQAAAAADSAAPQPLDRVIKLAQDITQPKWDEAFANYQTRVTTREHVVHGDFHVFNIMVGTKPPSSETTLEEEEEQQQQQQQQQFPPQGTVVICDWELSHVGPTGRDLGPFQAFPYSCMLAHVRNGNSRSADDIGNFLKQLWNEYDTQLFAKNKTEDDVRHSYRDALVFCGLYMIAYSALGIHINFLPIDSTNSTEALSQVKESIGVIGLKVFLLGCGGDTANLSLTDLRSKVQTAVDEEMVLLGRQGTAAAAAAANDDSSNHPAKERRSSTLRSNGVRVSDGHIHVTGLDRESFIALANLADSSMDGVVDDDE